jgi:hypothetical protein
MSDLHPVYCKICGSSKMEQEAERPNWWWCDACGAASHYTEKDRKRKTLDDYHE